MNTIPALLQSVTAPATDQTLGGSLSALSHTLASTLPMLGALGGIVIMVAGAVRLFSSIYRGGPLDGIPMILMGALVGGLSFFMPVLFDAMSPTNPKPAVPSPTPTQTPTPTATSEPTRAPEPVQQPADLTGLYITLGIIAGVILLILLGWLIVISVRKARRGIREARKEAAAQHAAKLRQAATWNSFHEHHEELLRKILHSETDWDSLFFTPALTDPSVPETYAMLKAMRTANTLRDTAGELPANLDLAADLTKLPYPQAVQDFALAWDAAERNAQRIGQKGIPSAERKIIKQIRTLLDLADNGAASQNERNLAYKRAQSLIESLESVTVPKRAIAQLEERHQLMLTPIAEAGKAGPVATMEVSR